MNVKTTERKEKDEGGRMKAGEGLVITRGYKSIRNQSPRNVVSSFILFLL